MNASPTPKPSPSLRITTTNRSRLRLKLSLVRQALEAVLGGREGAVETAILPAGEMRELNLRHRGEDRATDVLTFPAPPTAFPLLGEIALCEDFILKGAALRKVSPSQEAGMLALHGALHLAGMEDETPEGHQAMKDEMARLAPFAGLKPDPDWMSAPYPEGDPVP